MDRGRHTQASGQRQTDRRRKALGQTEAGRRTDRGTYVELKPMEFSMASAFLID